MNNQLLPARRLRLFVQGFALCLFVSFLCGCSKKTPTPVDADVASAVLKTTLDSWKTGETIQELKQQNDPIIVQESDWSDGLKLVSYRIVKSTPRDANLVVEVELELIDESDDASPFKKKREYLVSSHPVKTVFRNMMN